MKRIALLVLLLSVAFAGFAQIVPGARIGLNLADLNQEDNNTLDTKFGFHIGGLVQYPVAENVLLQPELLYTMKGATANGTIGTVHHDYTYTYNYLELPILVKYDLVLPFVKVQPYLGPSLGLPLIASFKDEFGNQTNNTNVKDDTESLEFGLNLGADFILMENIMAGVRYNYGLTNIMSGASKDVTSRTLMFNFGYLFNQE